ncbi:MAG: hypothetical protein HY644_14045 [Acidobacteria bacterium]|nr:hypothetical protein [Acidobacteriota bacterium]
MAQRNLCILSSLVFLVNSFVQAEVVSGRWEKVDALQPGKRIVVILKVGDRIDSAFHHSEHEYLALTDSSGRERRILKSDIGEIVREDSALNGTLNGLLLGFLGGAAMGGAVAAKADTAAKYSIPFWGAAGAGAGALIGRAVDKTRKEMEVIYRSR